MRAPLVAAAVLAGSIGVLGVSQISAQRQAPLAAPGNGVAVLDVYSILLNSAAVKQAKQALESENQAKRDIMKKEGDRGNQLAEKLRGMPPGSPERQKLEREVMRLKADFDMQGKRFDRDLQEKEIKVFYALSRDIQDELDRYAKANGIQLVLRFDPPPPDLTDPQNVAHEVSRFVVYQRANDITPSIVEAVNRRAPAVGSATRAPAQSKPAPR
jgi:Skp family chaperone for outer membrane proteins